MAVTCFFTKNYGSVVMRADDGSSFKTTVWAGGNCIMVMTDENKCLCGFFSDLSHLRKCAEGNFLESIIVEAELSCDLPFVGNIASIFAKHGIKTTILPEKKEAKA